MKLGAGGVMWLVAIPACPFNHRLPTPMKETVMDWFEQVAKAKANGREYADNGIAAGQKTPDESPLSGEWAGALTPRDVVNMAAGADVFDNAESWEVTELCDAWEDGYNSAPWPEPAGELCEHGLSAWLCGGPNHWYDHEVQP